MERKLLFHEWHETCMPVHRLPKGGMVLVFLGAWEKLKNGVLDSHLAVQGEESQLWCSGLTVPPNRIRVEWVVQF